MLRAFDCYLVHLATTAVSRVKQGVIFTSPPPARRFRLDTPAQCGLRIEPISCQKTENERGHWSPNCYFGFLKFCQVWCWEKKTQSLFQGFSYQIEKKNRDMCKRIMVYVYRVRNKREEKWTFWLNVKMVFFLAVVGGFVFLLFKLYAIWAVQKVLYGHFWGLGEKVAKNIF